MIQCIFQLQEQQLLMHSGRYLQVHLFLHSNAYQNLLIKIPLRRGLSLGLLCPVRVQAGLVTGMM